jgi:ATP-dependent RNA helicase DeaD
MSEAEFSKRVGPAIAEALSKRGFTELTPVQLAVLDAAVEGRDLRITSQTGSGKTVAIGLALRETVLGAGSGEERSARRGAARPRALVVAPTRELAKQVMDELTWLYEPLEARVASSTGGASYRLELKALSEDPAVVVGTPGRLLDHLSRGAIDGSAVEAVVLDEADRMLDMGFRDDLDAIFTHLPDQRRTHLVTATFPREVLALADRVQSEPVHVEGTRLGAANTDIDHIIHLVDARERFAALVNLLLGFPDEQMLVFARTRADVAELATELAAAGFPVSALSGEMEQRERDRALETFRRSEQRALVATDVAARGIDVQTIARVVHMEPPTDPDAYTHRSGRTGRAGRKGASSLLVPPSALRRTLELLRRARVPHRFDGIPTPEAIRAAADQRTVDALTADVSALDERLDARTRALAERLAQVEPIARTLGRLLVLGHHAGPTEPRHVRRIEPPMRPGSVRPGPQGGDRGAPRGPAPARDARPPRFEPREDAPRFDSRPPRFEPREDAPRFDSRPPRFEPREDFPREEGSFARSSLNEASAQRARGGAPEAAGPRRGGDEANGEWTAFRVTWGEVDGADPRRLLAVVCRRGGIPGHQVGAIRVGPRASLVQVASQVAAEFAQAAAQRDPRNPNVRIELDRFAGNARPEPRARAEASEREAPRARPARARPEAAPRARAEAPRARPETAPREHGTRAGVVFERPEKAARRPRLNPAQPPVRSKPAARGKPVRKAH